MGNCQINSSKTGINVHTNLKFIFKTLSKLTLYLVLYFK